jgi:hypothetical protein
MFPSSTWPLALEKGCREWKTVNDNKYRSNIVLFDYLQQHKTGGINPSRIRRTIIKVPENIENELIDFDASSIFDFLNSHFDQSTHYIANMILVFQNLFCSNNQEIFRVSIEDALNQSGNYDQLFKNLMKEIKNFVMIVLQTMIYYYGGLLAKKMQENPSQMYDFILDKIINRDVHDLLVQAFNISKPQDYLLYQRKLAEFERITCKDLQIKDRFCMDSVRNDGINGFTDAIERLKELENRYTPIHKLEVISITNELICESVDDYWKDRLEPDQLVIDADNFLSIYIYIVLKSGLKNVKSFLWIIKQLGRKNMQNGMLGYYLTTLEACVLQIETLDLSQ